MQIGYLSISPLEHFLKKKNTSNHIFIVLYIFLMYCYTNFVLCKAKVKSESKNVVLKVFVNTKTNSRLFVFVVKYKAKDTPPS